MGSCLVVVDSNIENFTQLVQSWGGGSTMVLGGGSSKLEEQRGVGASYSRGWGDMALYGFEAEVEERNGCH